MSIPELTAVLSILQDANISACLVGEIALNYYNVPRVVHDIEICIPAKSVSTVSRLLQDSGLFQPAIVDKFHIYNEYKRGCPRLRYLRDSAYQAILFLSDEQFGLAPLSENVVTLNRPLPSLIYSDQILSYLSQSEIQNLPLPRLPSLIAGLSRRYLQSNDDIAAIAVEQLVDGMDLDDAWCARNLDASDVKLRPLVRRFVDGKQSRLDYFSDNKITCFIADAAEAKRVQKIPGYEQEQTSQDLGCSAKWNKQVELVRTQTII